MSARNISWIGPLILQPRRAVNVGAKKAQRYGGGHVTGIVGLRRTTPPGPIRPNRAVTVGAKSILCTAAAS
jgi:hypothetical protein